MADTVAVDMVVADIVVADIVVADKSVVPVALSSDQTASEAVVPVVVLVSVLAVVPVSAELAVASLGQTSSVAVH